MANNTTVPERISNFYESVDDSARDFFLKYGHVALANVYDPSLGQEASIIKGPVKGDRNIIVNGQIYPIRYKHLPKDDPQRTVVDSIIETLEKIGSPFTDIGRIGARAHMITQSENVVGRWHQDNGVAVTTLVGKSDFEVRDETDEFIFSYPLESGFVVLMDPTRYRVNYPGDFGLLHRGNSRSGGNRVGLAIASDIPVK